MMSPLELVFFVLFVMILAYAVWKRSIIAAIIALVVIAVFFGVL